MKSSEAATSKGRSKGRHNEDGYGVSSEDAFGDNVGSGSNTDGRGLETSGEIWKTPF